MMRPFTSPLYNPQTVREMKEQDRYIKKRCIKSIMGSPKRKYVKIIKEAQEGWCIGWKRPRHYVGIENLTIDHMLPLSRGGTHDPTNLIGMCMKCNSKKGTEKFFEWL